MSQTQLPQVIVSSVIRSSKPSESHGGLYCVDLETGQVTQLMDWNSAGINWEGRGQDRGLRGMAFSNDEIYLAASDEIFIYDRQFNLRRSIRQTYLKHCHEIFLEGDDLYVSSTGFDSVLQYSLSQDRWVAGYCLRYSDFGRALKKIKFSPPPRLSRFDPNTDNGPHPQDSSHLNQVWYEQGRIFACGTGFRHLVSIENGRRRVHARVPYWTHNCRPWRDGVLANATELNKILYADRRGNELWSVPIPHYPEEQLLRQTTRDHARQAFGRGLCTWGDYIIAGSSPATVSVYSLDSTEPIKSINLTMDVRNAVHGLEVWPYDQAPQPAANQQEEVKA